MYSGLGVGTAVELAGYGLTETGSSRALRFLVESITQMDASSIVVSGFGASGACDGDSGGPLLVRNPQGSLAVGGVLAMGSSTCNEEDTYLRLDPVLAWIQSTTGAYAAGADACGTIDHVGRCLYGSAVWCDSGGLTAQSCDARGESCGWDAQGGLFRCVDSEADPCRGIDATGACRDNAALRCDHGTLLQTSCAPCGTCRLNSKSGTPACDAL